MVRFLEQSDTKCGNANHTKLVSLTAIVLACLFALAMSVGCASQSSPSANSAEPAQPAGETAEQSNEAADVSDSSTDAQKETDSESTSTFKKPSDEDIALYNEWADDTVCNALNNLADEGVISQPPSDAEYLGEAFEYSGGGIAFLDEEAGEELSGSYTLPAGKVIMADFDHIVSEAPHATEVFYANGNWGPDGGGDPTLFYPQSMFGYFDQYEMQDILTDVPIQTFANSTDECDYLIVFDGVPSRVEEGFYAGGWDRISTTTLVLIIDVKQGKIVHIENVGTDTPPSMGADSNEGSLLTEELIEYLHDLLMDQPKS